MFLIKRPSNGIRSPSNLPLRTSNYDQDSADGGSINLSMPEILKTTASWLLPPQGNVEWKVTDGGNDVEAILDSDVESNDNRLENAPASKMTRVVSNCNSDSITQRTLPTHDSLSFDNHPDLSLILAMERTLFAALNNAWLLSIGGIGLMSVGSGDTRAEHAGMGIMLGGILTAFSAFAMHYLRVRQVKENIPSQYSHTLMWTGMLAILSICALVLEIRFGVLHPYLDREKAVTIAN
jgi:uncharacterized membrane protein YidH (DUF202 family)